MNLTLFDTLEAGDILFVDSSHVLKAGSDCQLLFSSILPRLNPGFSYISMMYSIDSSIRPSGYEGRGSNQQYALRAFLQFNGEFRIGLSPHI